MIGPHCNEHCSRWSGIPQRDLSHGNRDHIELLCAAFGLGPWNIPTNWNSALFGCDYFTEFSLRQPQFASYDSNRLTRLVILAHDRCIRIEISPKTFTHLTLRMWSGRGRGGSMSQRHPTIEDAVASLRGQIGGAQ